MNIEEQEAICISLELLDNLRYNLSVHYSMVKPKDKSLSSMETTKKITEFARNEQKKLINYIDKHAGGKLTIRQTYMTILLPFIMKHLQQLELIPVDLPEVKDVQV